MQPSILRRTSHRTKSGLLIASGPRFQVPAYANAGGTGDRTASITCTTDLLLGGALGVAAEFVNGSTASATTFFSPQIQAVAGKIIEFDFGALKLITEMKFYQQVGAGSTHGVWITQGWDGSNWVSKGSNFTLGTADVQTITELASNTQGYSKLRLLGVSGTTDETAWPFVCEFEFKIGNLV